MVEKCRVSDQTTISGGGVYFISGQLLLPDPLEIVLWHSHKTYLLCLRTAAGSRHEINERFVGCFDRQPSTLTESLYVLRLKYVTRPWKLGGISILYDPIYNVQAEVPCPGESGACIQNPPAMLDESQRTHSVINNANQMPAGGNLMTYSRAQWYCPPHYI